MSPVVQIFPWQSPQGKGIHVQIDCELKGFGVGFFIEVGCEGLTVTEKVSEQLISVLGHLGFTRCIGLEPAEFGLVILWQALLLQ
jgi:hypothetical protein